MDALAILFTVLRLLLAGVLLMAAAGKLLHRQAHVQTLAAFGVPAALRPSLAWLMPASELAIALMLTLAVPTWWGAFAGGALGSWHRQYQGLVPIAVVLRVDAGQLHRPRAADACITLLQEDRQVSGSYDALVTPSAVLVSSEGTIASHLALGSKEIYDLLLSTVPQIYENREIAA
ncbi:MauE/DoxX family redox-associated membrane protein [Duganella sp. PWIR1]